MGNTKNATSNFSGGRKLVKSCLSCIEKQNTFFIFNVLY